MIKVDVLRHSSHNCTCDWRSGKRASFTAHCSAFLNVDKDNEIDHAVLMHDWIDFNPSVDTMALLLTAVDI